MRPHHPSCRQLQHLAHQGCKARIVEVAWRQHATPVEPQLYETASSAKVHFGTEDRDYVVRAKSSTTARQSFPPRRIQPGSWHVSGNRQNIEHKQQRRHQHNYPIRPSLKSPSTSSGRNDNPSPFTGGAGASSRSNSTQGPHKEYFQSPEQSPQPDFTPYVRGQSSGSPSTRSSFEAPPPAYLQYHPGAQQTPQPSSTSPPSATTATPTFRASLPRRLLRSTILIVLFMSLGASAGTGLITWEYLAPMYEEGSDQERELVEDIIETLEDSSLVFGLREDGWREVNLSTPQMVSAGENVKSLAGDLGHDGGAAGGHRDENDAAWGRDGHHEVQGRAEGIGMGRSMLYQVLTGSKGLVGLKMFHHPSEDYSVMVFFTGFGIEGWPDVVHGGMVTTLLEEAVQKHIDWFHRGQFDRVVDVGVKVDFKKPVQPGEIYAVLVPPAVVDAVRDQNNLGMTSGLVPTGFKRLKVVSLFMQLEGAPKVSSGMMVDGGRTVEHKIEIPGREGQPPDIHAVAEITMKVFGGNSDEADRQHENILDSITKSNAAFGGLSKKTRSDVGAGGEDANDKEG